jgi:hypothetical protein
MRIRARISFPAHHVIGDIPERIGGRRTVSGGDIKFARGYALRAVHHAENLTRGLRRGPAP